jgi:predicted dithiol-disulfide oxidoreductase (DUF899 family)
MEFPGETAEYRHARAELLQSEVELRRQMEAVAEQRRRLPLGGEPPHDYVFQEAGPDGEERAVRLSELFAPGQDTLVVYSYMFGPQMKEACPLCTSILDGLDAQAPHITQTVSLAVVARSPLARVRDLARRRGWRHLRLLSSADNSYNRDYHGESPQGDQWPMLNVFVERDGRVRHSYATEMFSVGGDRGQDPRHVDLVWPLWNVLDLTPGGRPKGWYPKLAY